MYVESCLLSQVFISLRLYDSLFHGFGRIAQTQKQKMKILFLCTGNCCRSQMAEGWTKHLKADIIEAYSARIETHGLNPNAVKIMAEAGVDIAEQRSKHLDEVKHINFDYVITVCDHAHESCPMFPGKNKVIHVGFDAPPKLVAEVDGEAKHSMNSSFVHSMDKSQILQAGKIQGSYK